MDIFVFINNLSSKIIVMFANAFAYFQKSYISTLFFLFVIVVIILNIVRFVLIHQEQKHGNQYQPCKFLVIEANKQYCVHSKHKKYFEKNKNGCKGCTGKVCMTSTDAEYQLMVDSLWKKIPIIMANYCKSALPYVSFLYTLCIAIFEK